MIRKYFITLVLLIGMLGIFLTPLTAGALFPTHDYIKDAENIIFHIIVKQTIKIVTSRIRDIILNPGDGNNGPAYITNWRSYLQEIEMQGTVVGQQIVGAAIYGPSGTTNQGTVCGYLQQQVGYMVGARQPDTSTLPSLAKYQDQGVDFKNKVGCTAPTTVTPPNGTPTSFDVVKYANGEPGYFTWEYFNKLHEEQNRAIPAALLANEEIQRNTAAQKEVKLNQGIADQGFRPLVTAFDIVKSPGSYVKSAATSVVDTSLACFNNINIDSLDIGGALAVCLTDALTANLKNFGGIDLKGSPSPTPAPGTGPSPTPPTFIQWDQDTCNRYCDATADSQCLGGVVLNISVCKQNARFSCFVAHAKDGCKL